MTSVTLRFLATCAISTYLTSPATSQGNSRLSSDLSQFGDALSFAGAVVSPQASRVLDLADAALSAGSHAVAGRDLGNTFIRVGADIFGSTLAGIGGTAVCGPICGAAASYFVSQAIELEFERYDRGQQQLAELSQRPSVPISVGPAGSGSTTHQNIALLRSQTSQITGSGVSHIGLPGVPFGSQPSTEVRPAGLTTGGSSFQEGPLQIVVGSSATHLSTHNSYGSISSPTGTITAINNAGVSEVVAIRDYQIGRTAGTFTLQALANFVTTEFPTFVGTEFNDTATITVRTAGGQTMTLTARQLFQASVNGSRLTAVTGVPSPLAGNNPNNGAGQTGWQNVFFRANVAAGSRISVEIRVRNVGDTALPSAILVTRPTAR